MAKLARIALTIERTDGQLPTEFRLFCAGENKTSKGVFVFDAAAAKSVMEAYASHGVDIMIDLEHQSLGAPSIDPTARDARGWCKLEVRNGELWAVSARWTPDGELRLLNKSQRYASPVFEFDPATGRILSIFNLAITATPATHKAPALVAASSRNGAQMDQATAEAMIAAITAQDGAAALDILQKLLVSDIADEAAEPSTSDVAAAASAADQAGMQPGDAKKPVAQASALSGAFMRQAMALSGKSDPGAALAELSRRSRLIADVEAREAKLASDRAAIELSERKALVASLVKLGAETPATAWSDASATAPCQRLSSEPIESMRERVAALGNAKPGIKVSQPMQAHGSVAALSDKELAICKETNVDPAEFAARKAQLKKA